MVPLLLIPMHKNSVDNVNLFNPLNAELNPIRHLLALAGAHHFVDVSRIKVKAIV
jgi:hypothetical protein